MEDADENDDARVVRYVPFSESRLLRRSAGRVQGVSNCEERGAEFQPYIVFLSPSIQRSCVSQANCVHANFVFNENVGHLCGFNHVRWFPGWLSS